MGEIFMPVKAPLSAISNGILALSGGTAVFYQNNPLRKTTERMNNMAKSKLLSAPIKMATVSSIELYKWQFQRRIPDSDT